MKLVRSAVALSALAAVLVAGCGDDGSSSDDAATDTAADTVTGADVDAADVGTVLALGEEFLLADLLALGVTPVASTATVSEEGFQGLDEYDTSEIEPLPGVEPNFERFASFQPEVIVTTEFVVDQIGTEELEGIAEEVVIVPNNLTADEQIEYLGQELGREEQAEALVAELDEARAEFQASAPGDCDVSLATIYPGPTPAAWVGPPNLLAIALTDWGCDLSPSADSGGVDVAGRIYLSEEQLGLLDAPVMVLFQNDTVDGENAALKEIDEDPLWQQLPAVEADNVVVLDRLGYPGIDGLMRLYDDLAAELA